MSACDTLELYFPPWETFSPLLLTIQTLRPPRVTLLAVRIHSLCTIFFFFSRLLLDDRLVRQVADHPALELLRRCQLAVFRDVLEVDVGVGTNLGCPSVDIYTYIHICMCACVKTIVHVCRYVCARVCACVYAHMRYGGGGGDSLSTMAVVV